MNRLVDLIAFLICLILLIAVLSTVGGCALFRGGRVEARADYNVVAQDCAVSLVAVGYCGEGSK